MATFIKGKEVTNATSYELAEKASDGAYNVLASKDEINFELDSLGLAAGKHTLVVKAKADGWEDSDYSNEVVYDAPRPLAVISGTAVCTTATPSLTGSAYATGFTPGRTYEYSITTDYDGKLGVFTYNMSANKGSMFDLLGYNNSGVSCTAGVPITGTLHLPYEGMYRETGSWNGDTLAFRTYVSTESSIEYTFTELDIEPNPHKGTLTFGNATVDLYAQGIFVLEAGATYNYKFKTDYTGNITPYFGISDVSKLMGAVDLKAGTAINVTAGTEVTGSFTVPNNESTTYPGRVTDCVLLRSHVSNMINIEYELTKVS